MRGISIHLFTLIRAILREALYSSSVREDAIKHNTVLKNGEMQKSGYDKNPHFLIDLEVAEFKKIVPIGRHIVRSQTIKLLLLYAYTVALLVYKSKT